MADSKNVYVPAPPEGGAGVFFRAKLGTTLPTDAIAELDPAFNDLGYAGDSGFVNSPNRETSKIKAFGGATVANPQSDYSETLQVVLLEEGNPEVLKTTFGDDNVTVVGGKTTVLHNKSILPRSAYVVDTISGNRIKRQVVPEGQVITVGEITQVSTDVIRYTLTIEAYEDTNGNNMYEYSESGDAPAAPVIDSLAPASVSTVGGDLVTVNGSGFTGATDVTVDAITVEYTVIDDTKLVFSAPADTAGAVDVVVTNAVGASAPASLTYA